MLDFLDLQMLAAQETRQYLIWDREGEETTVDHVTTTLFQAAEKDEDEKTRGRSRGRSRIRRERGPARTWHPSLAIPVIPLDSLTKVGNYNACWHHEPFHAPLA